MERSGEEVREEGAYRYKNSWLQLTRPLTWCGTISPIVAGSILAVDTVTFRPGLMVLLLVSAILIQISANILNDYFDFKGGQDQERWEEVDVQSGEGPYHHQLPAVAVVLLSTAVILGAWLALFTGWWIVWIGTAGIVAGVCYSAGQKSLASAGLGETTAFLFLGIVATLLGYSVQTGNVSFPAFGIAILFGLLISMMIWTNNLRDVDKDDRFRKTVAIRLGKKRAKTMLAALVFLPYAGLLILMMSGAVTSFVVVAALALPLALKLPLAFGKHGTKEKETSAMKTAALHHWTFGGLLVAGLWAGTFF